MTPLKTLVIFNPVSGAGRAARIQPEIAALLNKHGCAADFVVSQSSEHVRRCAKQAATAGYRTLAVLGGDGTIHHAVNGAFGTGIDFAFFPAGNGNDIARGLGIPLDPVAAAYEFLRGRPRAVDVLRARFGDASQHIFLGAGGMGLDAEAARLVHGKFSRLPGATRYIAAALWALARYKPVEVDVALDGAVSAEASGPVLLAAVANGPCYGSGVMMAPGARMDDGVLDVTLVRPLPFARILEAIPIVLRTGPPRWPEILRFRAGRVALALRGRLQPDAPKVLFHGDGEVLGTAPVEVEVLPGAIRVVC